MGGHYIYHCEDTSIYKICPTMKVDNPSEEARLLSLFRGVDLSRNFYFSYTYDVTSTLQHNLTKFGYKACPQVSRTPYFNDRYAWNHYLLSNAFPLHDYNDSPGDWKSKSPWVIPMIYGHVDQASKPVFLCGESAPNIPRTEHFWAHRLHHAYRSSLPPFCWCSISKARS